MLFRRWLSVVSATVGAALAVTACVIGASTWILIAVAILLCASALLGHSPTAAAVGLGGRGARSWPGRAGRHARDAPCRLCRYGQSRLLSRGLQRNGLRSTP